MLAEVNRQLDTLKGSNVKESQGSLDTTVITSTARPKRELKAIAVDHQEEKVTHIVQEDETLSKDPNAHVAEERETEFFGYKGFMTKKMVLLTMSM